MLNRDSPITHHYVAGGNRDVTEITRSDIVVSSGDATPPIYKNLQVRKQ